MSTASLLSQIRQLPVSEQVELLREVWDALADSGEAIGLTPQQQRELDRRLQEHRESPEDVIPWEQARAEIERELSRAKRP